jgi:hypothetical protein
MLEFSMVDQFNTEISRIKSKYEGGEFIPKNEYDKPKETNPELVAKIEDLEAKFTKKF